MQTPSCTKISNEQILFHAKHLLICSWCLRTKNYSPNKNASLGGRVKRRFDYGNQAL